MRNNRGSKATLVNALSAFILVSLLASGFSTAANIYTRSGILTKEMSIPVDTVKMVAGVPLKAEDVSPLLIGEQIPVLQMRKSTGEMFD